MRLELTGRHVEITPALRRLVDKKLTRLRRVLNDSAVSAQVVLTREKNRQHAEITLHARGEKFLHGDGDSPHWETSLARAVEKISQQAQRVKGKWAERKRQSTRAKARALTEVAPAAAGAEGAAPRIVRAPRYPVKPMTVEEAALEVDATRDAFLVFRNAHTDTINVLYRRKNGDLALIET